MIFFFLFPQGDQRQVIPIPSVCIYLSDFIWTFIKSCRFGPTNVKDFMFLFMLSFFMRYKQLCSVKKKNEAAF